MKLLFVCLGNICRSPAAEAIALKQAKELGIKNIQIDSAATGNHTAGMPPDSRMVRHASQRGYTLNSVARPVTYNDFETADIIVAMDDSNYNTLKAMAPNLNAAEKVVKMISYCKKDRGYDYIPDPYYGGANGFELVLDLLEDGILNLLNEIGQAPKP